MKTKKAITLITLCFITLGAYAQTDTGRINKMPTTTPHGIRNPMNKRYQHKVDTAMHRKSPRSMPNRSPHSDKDTVKRPEN